MKPSQKNGKLTKKLASSTKRPLQERNQNATSTGGSFPVDLPSSPPYIGPASSFPSLPSWPSLKSLKSEGRLEDPEICPADSASQIDANDDFLYDSFDDMTDGSDIYANTELTAGGADYTTFRKRLDKAGLDSEPDIDTRHDAVIALIRSPKALPKVQEKKLIGRLIMLSTKLERDSVASEAYLESNMNQIIEATISPVDHVEVYHNSIPWNRIPLSLSRVVGLSSPVPDGSIGYPTLGETKLGVLVETSAPYRPANPLGRQVLEYILRTSYAEKVPLNYTNVQKTIDVHDVLLFEYKNKDGEDQKAVSHCQSLNVGMFKVWQDVDLANFLDQKARSEEGKDHSGKGRRQKGKWITAISKNPPFCLVFRICGTYWALDYIAATPPFPSTKPKTISQIISEGDWAKDACTFLRTLQAAYRVCAKRVKEFRGGMMRDLYELAKAEAAEKGLGKIPKNNLPQRVYRKRPPPTPEVSNRVATENAQAAKDGAAAGSLEGWMRDMALTKPDDESQ